MQKDNARERNCKDNVPQAPPRRTDHDVVLTWPAKTSTSGQETRLKSPNEPLAMTSQALHNIIVAVRVENRRCLTQFI